MLWLGLPWLSPPALGASAAPDRTPIADAAQDGSGQVWGAGGFGGRGLHRWQGSGWQDVRLPWTQGYSAVAVAGGPDGRVYCVWQDIFKPDSLISVHHGEDSRLLARFPGKFERTTSGTDFAPTIFPEAGGGAWVMGQRSVLWHIGLNGRVRAFQIPTRWFFPKRTPQRGNDYYEATLSAEDGQGRRWFWSDALAGFSDSACLRGVLLWDGKTLTSHPTLPGVPNKPFSVIVPEDAAHFWLAVNDDGLYQVDSRTLQGRRAPPPERGAFLGIEKIFRAKGDWYLLDWPSNGTSERSVVLWRQQGDGHWKKLAPGLDKGVYQFDQQDRPWLATRAGVWLGTFSGGAWWLPSGGKTALPIDWRRGFPLSSVYRLFRLRDGRLLAASYGGSVIIPLVPPPLLPRPVPIRTFLADSTLSDLTSDAGHHLWGLLAADTRLLSEWDGAAWRKHPVPKSVALDKMTLFAWDTSERLWLLPFDHDGPAAIFDPTAQTWTAFASCQAAYQAQTGIPAFGLRTKSRQPMPRFGTGGRICFLSGEYYVHFFDGHVWKKWKMGTITGETDESQGIAGSDGPPFFNAADHLSINQSKKSWEWTPGAGWHPAAAYEVGPDDNSTHSSPEAPPAPPGSPARAGSVIWDGPDAAWETDHRQLYKVAFGLAAPQFAPGTAQPFLDGRVLTGLRHDRRGNLFFTTDADEHVLLPAVVPPETHLSVTSEGTGGARLEMTTTATGPHWFVWRLDGGAWSAATRAGSVPLDFLPGGPHIAEALALDERLAFNPLTARAAFTVQADPKEQIQALIDTLKTGDDRAREAAVTHLLRFPALAPPALRSARLSADDDTRWWIDAALEQLGDAAPKPKAEH